MRKFITFTISTLVLFSGCSLTPTLTTKEMPNTPLVKSSFSELPEWERENHEDVLDSFINSCQSSRTQKLYSSLCEEAKKTLNAKSFLESEFQPYVISSEDEDGLLTGYYEPELSGSLNKSEEYAYPVYSTPSDLIIVDLHTIYPDLKEYRLRGRIEGNRLVPYYSRAQSKGKNSEIICYTNSKVDLFFLEIQGSGRIKLDNGETIFVGYDNQNGYKYRAIGRYLVEIGALKMEEVSLQSIRAWLEANPSRIDEVLNYNKSVVYFSKRSQAATGSLGLELTPKRSVAVDRKYIPLGSLLYLNAKIDNQEVSRAVIAQDTGGAIKGALRADLFLGYGDKAMNTAGKLKSSLKLWALLPKKSEYYEE